MAIQLKDYQKDALAILTDYLSDARLRNPAQAYDRLDKSALLDPRPYEPIPGLDSVPYICLRLPTGGGKTLLSAHSIAIATQNYLEAEYPLVIWFTPTDKIRTQTLETLKDPNNHNYEALRDAFDGRFLVLDASDFTMLRPQDLKSKAVIVVATIQTFRVDGTEGRKVYAHNEDMEPHFSRIIGDPSVLEQRDDGNGVRYSFRNVIAMHRPLIIVDEAHNVKSELSVEVLKRLNPSCVIEYTATPERNSNVICNVSASQLKAEEMIKLPIVLGERKTWEEAVRDSVLARKSLADKASADSRYIRPIVLFQAENKDKEITVDVLTKHLVENEKIDRSKIAIVTGDQKELNGINLFDPKCPIDYVITIQALKEGWDCSFAYVFCSVAKVHSKKDVEQLLGRVLRMPYAKRRSQPELNKAYAFVSSSTWSNAVNYLHDRLVDMGFEQQEASHEILTLPFEGIDIQPTLSSSEPAPVIFETTEPISIPLLPENERKSVHVEATQDGGSVLTIDGPLSHDSQQAILSALPKLQRQAMATRLLIYDNERQRAISPAERSLPFQAPQLCVWIDGELELAERDICLPGGWDLNKYPAQASETEIALKEDGKVFEIDLHNNRVTERFIGTTDALNLDLVDSGWSPNELARWLNRAVQRADSQHDLSYEMILEHCRKFVNFMTERRGATLTSLVRGRFILARFLADRIKTYRERAYRGGFQTVMFEHSHEIVTSFEYDFSFSPSSYAPKWPYAGSFQLPNHYYSVIGELKSSGEEFESAKAIAMHPKVIYWVRNLSQSANSFWLPTSTDKFYPDFVVKLHDDRTLVIEYKGQDIVSNDDSKEKLNIGELWEDTSEGTALFLMAVLRDDKGRSVSQQIDAKVAS